MYGSYRSKVIEKILPNQNRFISEAESFIHAVNGIGLEIERGKAFGLVGKSGCGKTTAGNCILRLIEPTEGEVYFEVVNILELKRKEMRNVRSRMQIIFLNPTPPLTP